MFTVAWAMVEKEKRDSWEWLIEELKYDLCIGEGLGWSLISDMQKVYIEYIIGYHFFFFCTIKAVF